MDCCRSIYVEEQAKLFAVKIRPLVSPENSLRFSCQAVVFVDEIVEIF